MNYDSDPGFAKLKATLNAACDLTVAVGIFPDSGYEPGTEITTAQVAAVHEYGSNDGRIPARSFLRSTTDLMAEELEEMRADALIQEIEKPGSIKTSLAMIGMALSSKIQTRIRSNEIVDASNGLAAATIARKQKTEGGAVTPLIDTSHMVNSITYKVRPDSENNGEGVLEV